MARWRRGLGRHNNLVSIFARILHLVLDSIILSFLLFLYLSLVGNLVATYSNFRYWLCILLTLSVILVFIVVLLLYVVDSFRSPGSFRTEAFSRRSECVLVRDVAGVLHFLLFFSI